MELGTTLSQLEEMKVLAAGNPRKIADYALAKKRYEETVAEFFNEESGVKFYAHPTESYITELEAKAEKTGDPNDKARAAIMRDRFAHYAKEKTQHIDWRISRERLHDLLGSGGKVTQKDIDEAYRVARHNPTPEMSSLYSRLKSVKQAQEEGTYQPPAAPEPPKVTAEDVEAAREEAQRTSSTKDIAKYAALKRKYEGVV